MRLLLSAAADDTQGGKCEHQFEQGSPAARSHEGAQSSARRSVQAAADGMRNAVGTPSQWQALADSALAHGEIPWISQETPPRPPMLSNFGLVRTWLMTPGTRVRRPAR